jgi:hypothetical protein
MATREEYEDAIKKIKEAFYSAICEEWELEQIAVNLDFLLSLINEHFKEHPETNYEHYKDEILKDCMSNLAVVKGKPKLCPITNCSDCDFKGSLIGCHKRVKDWLKQTHEKPVYKLTKFEKELLECYSDVYSFKVFNSLNGMKEKGYFKDVDTKIPICEILDNCEVIK